MHQSVLTVVILAVFLSLVAVACGGGEDQQQRMGLLEERPAIVSGVTSRAGNVVDFTLNALGGGSNPNPKSNLHNTIPYSWDVTEMTFAVGDTVNFTIVPYGDGTEHALRDRHTFNIKEFGTRVHIKYGKASTVSITFDKPGEYRYWCDNHPGEYMEGVITVQ